jgi:hypothetical protein
MSFYIGKPETDRSGPLAATQVRVPERLGPTTEVDANRRPEIRRRCVRVRSGVGGRLGIWLNLLLHLRLPSEEDDESESE